MITQVRIRRGDRVVTYEPEERTAAFTLRSGLMGNGQRRPAMVGSWLGGKGSRVRIPPSRLVRTLLRILICRLGQREPHN
jgi:hypothetical protein